MKISIKIISLLCIMNTLVLSSQENKLKKANTNYDSYAYSEAIRDYKEIIKNGNGTIEIYQKLGDCYFFNANLEEASKWYKKMMEKKNELEQKGKEVEEITAEYYFRTSQSFKHLKQYKEADSLLLKVKELSANDSRAKRLIENPEYLEEITMQSGRYDIINMNRNSTYVDFAPSFYKDQLVFSSARGSIKLKSKRNRWTKQPYLDLYIAIHKDSVSFEYPEAFSRELNSRLHESTTSFTKDGKMAYFTRNNLLKSKFGKDSTGVNRLKIYTTTLNDKSNWSNIQDLSFNSDEYSVAHPALSPDEKKLYFASDMPGGYGMSDLYVVDINEDGTFGTPQNLGPGINTEGRETFPFISKSGKLYFASDGHLGLGGLDIFTINFEDEDEKVYNLGEPINSSADDITFIINEDTRKGYFASNRPGGAGDDDIYSFIEITSLVTKCKGVLKGIIIDEDSDDALVNANVEIKNENGEVIYSGKTDKDGEFLKDVDCADKTYEIAVKKEGYHPVDKKVTVTRQYPTPSDFIKLKQNLPEKGIDLAKLLNLKPIYFASGKASILDEAAKELDKVVTYMKEYPSIRIEIGSHTDSRGSDRSNLILSKRRATSTANYFIRKNIAPSRVKSRGYGETVLINKCGNRVKCSQQEHRQNRRSEFIVLEN